MICKCQDCGHNCDESKLKPMPLKGIFERVAPGEPMPYGECPKCGAVSHPVRDISGNEWYARKQASGQFIVYDDSDTICIVTSRNASVHAQLICAAPDMLKTLHLIYSQSLGKDWTARQAFEFIRKEANKAINLAEVGR